MATAASNFLKRKFPASPSLLKQVKLTSYHATKNLSTMDAVVCYGPRDYRIDKVAIPTAKDNEIIIKVTRVGICAGDSKCFAGAPHFWSPGEFGPSYCQPGVIPGHEFVGNVVELGPGASEKYGLRVGDQAIAEQIVPCRTCRYCDTGDYNMCLPHNIYGFRRATPGAMATFMKYVDGSRVHKISNSVPAEHAVYVEPLSCALYAVKRADIQLNDVVVIAGCGPIGLGAVAAAKLKNPKLLVVLDLFDWKLDIAKKCGADVCINVSKVDAIDWIKQMTGGYGCDKYIELTGKPVSVAQGLEMIARKGVFVAYSVFAEKTSVDWTVISDAKELEVKGGHLGAYQYPTAIRMIEQGLVPVGDIVTHCLPMSQFEKGFGLVDASAESIKVTLDPDA